MRTLQLPATTVTPLVEFDSDRGHLLMSGECYPENPTPFFAPIFAAVEGHFRRTTLREFEARFRLSYVNSASTKALRRLFGVLNAMAEHGISVSVAWVHDPDDDTAVELGEDLAAGLVRLGFHAEPVLERLAS
jgi:hypothetical protein